MYHLILPLLFILCGSNFIYSQCQPMAERDFQAAKQRMMMNSRNINAFQSAMDLGRMYCLSSSQARDIANYLANDRDKLDFLKSSFSNIADKENFTDVMDVFRLMSSAFRLYHSTLGSAGIVQPNIPISQNPNCQRPLDVINFQNLSRQVLSSQDDRTKASTILNATSQCMMTQQIIQLVGSIRDENIKVDVLKRLSPFVFDIENYSQAANTLSQNNRQLFLAYLQNPNGNGNGNNSVTEIDFEKFLAAIRKQSFDRDKESYIKTYIKNTYLNTGQIKTILSLLSFDDSKLDIAKFLFNNCVDKQNYFNVAESLQFSSSKTDLNDFVKSKM